MYKNPDLIDVYGILVNIKMIAKDLYSLIKEHHDGACLRLGMFPAPIMEALNNGLKKRIPSNYTIKGSDQIYEAEDTIKEIEHLVCCEILSLATNEGYCIV